MTDYNWETIKRQYIQGIKQEDGNKTYPSYRDLSKIHGCSPGAISNKSTNDPEGPWDEQRKRYLNKVEQKVDEKKSEDDWQSAYDSTLPDRYVNDNTVDIKGKTISIEVNTDTSTTTGKDTTTVKDTTTEKDTTTSTTTK